MSEIRMRERMSMKSKMLGALALLTLIGALFVMQSADQNTPTADAAHGSIAALNVGTCLTTDGTVFKGACTKLVNDDQDWEVRNEIAEVSTLYATYAFDPKTASEEPRVILTDSDLLRISIHDSGRDKRTGVLIRGASGPADIGDDDVTDSNLAKVIRADLDKLNFPKGDDPDANDDPDGDDGDIMYSSHTDGSNGITFILRGETDSIVDNSGNSTLNFNRTDGTFEFDPGDFDVDDGAVVRFYGCVDADANDSCDAGESLDNLEDYLSVDEDRSNGEADANTAPWLGINASVPSGDKIIIQAIYYQTSDEEHLVGGTTYCTGDDGVDSVTKQCPDATSADDMANDEPTDVVYTDNEKANNTSLKVEASADGDTRSVNLYLTEKGRFNGVYQGHLRLTDANGDGSVDDDPSTTAVETKARDDWGLKVGNAGNSKDPTDPEITDAMPAVLGVESGPVTITYRDSDGNTQTLRIEIDNRAPSINITSPADGSSSNDRSPDFAGSFEDPDSGLVDRSFRLVVDNYVDNNDGTNSDFALRQSQATYPAAPNADEVDGSGPNGMGKVTHIGEYTGYADDSDMTVGVTSASSLYHLGNDSCDEATCYIEAEEHDDGAIRGTFDDSVRLNLQDANGDADTRDKEFAIDFQAFVLDMAGNIGFSDSDRANPRYINAWGEDNADDRGPLGAKGKKHNVLGYYSAHVIKLDDKDPVIMEEASATGFYGLNADGKMIPDRTGIAVAFDGALASSSVGTNTFSVELDDGTDASVVDVNVAKNYVFLKLGSELASDATPKIGIAVGEAVEDLAGNDKVGREADAFDAKDGISPRLTVTLSGGSGTGTGNEGPEKLTRDKMTVHVSSDEALQGSPRIIVVCSSLAWNTGGSPDADNQVRENASGIMGHDIDDFVANLNGSFNGKPLDEISPVKTLPRTGNAPWYEFTCGYDATDDNFEDDFSLMGLDVSSLSRPGENWDYTWQNRSGTQELQDGLVTAVAFARDRSTYDSQNWGSASAEFAFDDAAPEAFDLQPEDGGVSKEDRPFVLIEFSDSHTVTLDSVELDDVEIADQFENPQANRFVYWPQSLARGEHEVEVEASDAAGNDTAFEYSFTVEARGKFLLELQAGWNAVSVPANPVDTSIGSVFTDPAVTTVIGWDTQGWRIAVRRDGVWESNQQYGALNDIQAKYGYWVKSDKFIDQPVALKGPISRSQGGQPQLIGIDTIAGWNFVGVIDQDGDQTESDAFGETLMADNKPVSAADYLRSDYIRAYSWDPTFSRFDNIAKDDTMTIGQGVWVYYEGGIAP